MASRWVTVGGALASSALVAYFTKSPFVFVLGMLVVMYYLLFTSQIFTAPSYSLSGCDITAVTWADFRQGGSGIYTFQVNKKFGLVVWLSQNGDTTQPALLLFINDSNRGTALYSYDGSLTPGSCLPTGSTDSLTWLAQGKAFTTSSVGSVGRATEAALVNVVIFPTGIYVYGATPDQMQMPSGSDTVYPPSPTSPIFLNSNAATDYFILSYINTDLSSPICYSNIGFASSEDYPGTVFGQSWLDPGNIVTPSVVLRSKDKGLSNTVDPKQGQIAFDDSWQMTGTGTGTITFQLNYTHTDDFQSGLVVIASPWPGYQDAEMTPTGGDQYYFYFLRESHGSREVGSSNPLPIGRNKCDVYTYCWEGVEIRKWSASGGSSKPDCEAWGRAQSEIGESLFQGWESCSGRNCSHGSCENMHGSKCILLDRTSPFDGSSGCCKKATTSQYQDYRNTMWNQTAGTSLTCYVEFGPNTMSMGFLDQYQNQQNILQQNYTPDPDNPLKYWGFAVVGLGDDGSFGSSLKCADLKKYSGNHSRLTLTNISIS